MAIDYRDQQARPTGPAGDSTDLGTLAALLESARIGMVWLSPKGTLERANAAAAAMLGVEEDAIAGRPLAEFLGDDGVAERLMERLQRGERVEREAITLRLPADLAVPATIDASPELHDGSFTGAVFLLREDFARRQLEHLRRTSELRWMTVADAMPALVAISRSDGEIIYFNRRFEEFAGKRTAELEGDGWLDIVHPDEVPESIERWTNAIARGERVQFQQRLRNSAGEYRTHLCLGEPIRNADRAIEMWIGVNIDVQDRVQSERIVEQALRDAQEREVQQQRADRAIRQSELEYRSLAEAMPVIVCTMDAAGRPLYLNRLWYEYTGMAPPGPDETPWRAAVHPDDYDGVVAQWRAGGERGEPVETEYRLRRHDGEFRWYLGRAIPIKDAAGVLTSWVLSTVDIQDRRAAEDALTESEERLRLATEHGRIGVWDWDLETDDMMMSDVDRRLLGLADGPSTVPIGEMQRVHPDDRGHLRDLLNEAVAGRSAFSTEFRIVLPDGEVRWLAASGSVTGDAEHPRMVGTHLDISARKRAELERDLFADLGEALSSPLDETALLNAIVRAVSPRFAQYCALYTFEPDGRIRRTTNGGGGGAGAADVAVQEAGARPSAPVERALRKGRETFVAELTDELLVQSAGTPGQLAEFREIGLSSAIVVPMTVRGAVIGALSIATGNARDRFGEDDLVTAREVARRVALNIDGTRLYADEQQARVRAQLLSRASATLAESLDYVSTLDAVANAVVPSFADWCAVDLVDESGRIERLAVAHVDPAKVKLAHQLEDRYPADLSAPHGLGQVLRSRETECLTEIPDALLVAAAKSAEDLEMFRALGLKSSICAPLVSRGRVLGAISFVSAESGRRFSADDIVTAEELARRAVLAIENAELYRKSRDAQRLLGERLMELETILDNVPVGIAISVDAACKEVIPNGALARMLHAPSLRVNISKRDEGASWFRLERDGAEIETAQLPMQRAGATGEPVLGEELDIAYEDGAPMMRLYASAVPLFDDDRGVRGVIGVYVDITERQKMEERLREALLVKDDFLGMVSHELKTPITTVRGNAEILLRRGDALDAESRQQSLEDINRESDRLHRIIENLLMLARVERGQEIEREPLLVAREVKRMVQAYGRQRPGREITVSADSVDLVALGDETHLEQVVNNLLANAEKYSPAGAPVDITVGRLDGMVAVRVLDRGIGVAGEEAEAIFSPFYRSPATASTAQGVGIGLSVCKRLVEAQGGTIWCAPRDGGGAEFGFTLPELVE